MLALVLLGATVVALAVGNFTRGHRRLILQRTAVYVGFPALTATLVLLPLQLDVAFSDALSLAGLCVSLLFGIGTKALRPLSMRVRVGVVIPSRVPFHTELRAGLEQALARLQVDLHDDYLLASRATERLDEFVPSLRRTLDWRPDYLVICSPSGALLSTENVLALLKQFSRRGGGIIFIDNEPDDAAREQLPTYGHVRADVEAAATLLVAYIDQHSEAASRVLVLSGPEYSDPAERYRRVLASLGTGLAVVSAGWSEQAAYSAALRHLDQGHVPNFILCGNDVIAFGAVRAVRERITVKPELKGTAVVGYNGIARALFAIAEPDNPFRATVSIPPAAYGHEIAAMIVSDATRMYGRTMLHRCCIPIGNERVIDENNIELVLES